MHWKERQRLENPTALTFFIVSLPPEGPGGHPSLAQARHARAIANSLRPLLAEQRVPRFYGKTVPDLALLRRIALKIGFSSGAFERSWYRLRRDPGITVALDHVLHNHSIPIIMVVESVWLRRRLSMIFPAGSVRDDDVAPGAVWFVKNTAESFDADLLHHSYQAPTRTVHDAA